MYIYRYGFKQTKTTIGYGLEVLKSYSVVPFEFNYYHNLRQGGRIDQFVDCLFSL